MTNKTKLMKGLLAATALTAFAAGTAQAQIVPNNYTAAGTSVSNSFTVDYRVGGFSQPPICTDCGPGSDGPTLFTVDRLVNLTVESDGNNTVAPGATDEQLVYSVLNTGNDTHGYALSIVEETTAPDNFNSDDPASAAPVLIYYVDDGDGVYQPGAADGAAITYDPLNPPQVAPDDLIWVVVQQDIPAGQIDGDRADITLIADSLNAGTTTPTMGDGDGNDILNLAENVLADGTSTPNEAANAGDDSATGAYIVSAADINAVKVVDVFSEDGAGCATIPGTASGGYAVPGACVEYVITLTNDGSEDATDVVVNDVLSDELNFVAATFAGDFTGGSFASPALPANGTDCTGGACVINLQGATLPAPSGAATQTSGTVTIRATVK